MKAFLCFLYTNHQHICHTLTAKLHLAKELRDSVPWALPEIPSPRIQNQTQYYVALRSIDNHPYPQANDNLIHFGPSSEFIGYEGLRILDLVDSPRASFALGFAKGSEFLEIFNHEILRMKEFGILGYELRSLNSRVQNSAMKDEVNEAFALGFDSVVFPFAILAASVVAAVLISIAENAMKRVL